MIERLGRVRNNVCGLPSILDSRLCACRDTVRLELREREDDREQYPEQYPEQQKEALAEQERL